MILDDISQHLQDGDAKQVTALVKKALEEGLAAQDILENGLLKGMGIIGEAFKKNEVFVPEVIVAARAMNQGAKLLKVQLAAGGSVAKGKVVLGTVKGDIHDIGKNLVKIMFEGNGLTVIDAGIDVSEDSFIEMVKAEKPDILALSSLLTTTMVEQGVVIEALKKAGLRDKVKVMVGGAPVSQEFADKIGADAYTKDAASAANAAVKLCQA